MPIPCVLHEFSGVSGIVRLRQTTVCVVGASVLDGDDDCIYVSSLCVRDVCENVHVEGAIDRPASVAEAIARASCFVANEGFDGRASTRIFDSVNDLFSHINWSYPSEHVDGISSAILVLRQRELADDRAAELAAVSARNSRIDQNLRNLPALF